MKIKKGDTVKALTGKDRGKTGKVIKVDYQKARAAVEGINLYKKHVRSRKAGQKGEIVTVARPINVSNLMVVCPNCQKASRVGYRKEKEGGIKSRICRRCRSLI